MGYEIDFLPVGDGERSGDAIALRYGNLHGSRPEQVVIVIDGGYADDGQALVDHLAEHYNTDVVDVVLSTHPDQDHVAGLEVLVASITVRELWMHLPWAHSQQLELSRSSRFESTQMNDKIKKSLQDVSDLEAIARARRVPIREPFAGLSTRDGVFSIWWPTVEYYEELLADIASGESHRESLLRSLLTKAADAVETLVSESLHVETLTDLGKTSPQNNSSAISLLQLDDRLSLFTGDAGMPALGQALDKLESAGFSPGSLNFVQVPHHGSRRNVGPTVLNRLLGLKGVETRIGLAVASTAPDGAPKHPAKKVTNAFRRRGYPVYTTQGQAKRHFWQAPERVGWSTSEPLPLYEVVEEDEG
jgi:beta-lactamase superfamily II metal-dependent hydrolase